MNASYQRQTNHPTIKLLVALIAGWLLIGAPLPTQASASSKITSSPLSEEQLALRQFLKDGIEQASSFEDRFDAEVWLLDMSQRISPFIKDPEQRLPFLQNVHREASAAKLPPELVLALIQIESGFDRFAVSSAGAQGLMQVMPFWKNEIGRPDDNLSLVSTNLRYGCQILQFYLQRERGNYHRALARYNGSLGKSWYPERVFKAWRKRWYNGELSYTPVNSTP
ncbi:lytic transglycosylase domain-containing protein [Spongiibacter pelagi]